jgi:hypothetical protein
MMVPRDRHNLTPYMKHCRALYEQALQPVGPEKIGTFEGALDGDFLILHNEGPLLTMPSSTGVRQRARYLTDCQDSRVER